MFARTATDGGAVRRGSIAQALDQLFVPDQIGDITHELLVEPGHQAADFGTFGSILAEQRVAALGFLEIFDDHAAIDDDARAVFEDGHLGCGIAGFQIVTVEPGLDRLGRDVELFFREGQSHLA